MGVPNSEVGYTSAMPRREDHEVHKDMWGGHWGGRYTERYPIMCNIPPPQVVFLAMFVIKA